VLDLPPYAFLRKDTLGVGSEGSLSEFKKKYAEICPNLTFDNWERSLQSKVCTSDLTKKDGRQKV
jgi:hypothetical protein